MGKRAYDHSYFLGKIKPEREKDRAILYQWRQRDLRKHERDKSVSEGRKSAKRSGSYGLFDGRRGKMGEEESEMMGDKIRNFKNIA